MALNKQALPINFAQGLDTKTDPKQVQVGRFLSLQNSVFDKGGLLQKRNGYQALPTLPDDTSVTLTTFNSNLLAIGENIQALSADSSRWIESGTFQPATLNVLPLVRNSLAQTTADVVVGNGLACAVYVGSDGNSYYQIDDAVTGQIVVPLTQLPATAALPRVFLLNRYFAITYLVTIGTTHLQVLTIPIYNPTFAPTTLDVSSQVSSLTAGYDGVINNNSLYLAWDGNDGGGAIRYCFIDSTLTIHTTHTLAGYTSTLMSVATNVETSGGTVWISFWESGSTNGYSAAFDSQYNTILAPTQTITTTVISELTSIALGMTLTLFYEVVNDYTASSTRTDYIQKNTITESGTVSSPVVVVRSVGIAGKAFYVSNTGQIYLLAVYGGALQPTYFLIDQLGNVVAKLAYSNASGYAATQILASATVTGSKIQMGYLYADLIQPVNKAQGVASVNGIYLQTGINLVTFTISDSVSVTSEIGNNLVLTGGITWAYDGVKPVEQNFNVWLEDIYGAQSGSGNLSIQQYYYVFTYEWTDAQGNVHRSAPSVPFGINVTSASVGTSIRVPTLRLTYKTAPNSVRIVGYRWSAGQPVYYQFTSATMPYLNDPAVDDIQITDTLSDAQIIGNLILYTTGGVVEDIAPPSSTTMTLFKSRLFLVDSEDQNLLWFSKQVIEATPIEMSDLFTIYVAPTISAQGSTGPITALSAMDDKLIIFKKDAIYYLTGTGPDNTGANNDFSDPIFITSTVGCANQQSIVFSPMGLIFESDKGRWILGRDLSTNYIGAPVEAYNGAVTNSAVNVPATNQVRMTLNTGVTLMYDYYFNQWGTFTNVPALSSTIYQGLHTYLNSFGQVYQELPGSYLDGSAPVLMSFTTSWLNLAGVQGYQRIYSFYLIGQYMSPHKLNVQVAYNYNPTPVQQSLITPNNFAPVYGQDLTYGSGTPYGGPGNLEQWRIFMTRLRCEAFQITVSEVYDPSYGVAAGAGLTLSGINCVLGIKRGYVPIKAQNSIGGQ